MVQSHATIFIEYSPQKTLGARNHLCCFVSMVLIFEALQPGAARLLGYKMSVVTVVEELPLNVYRS